MEMGEKIEKMCFVLVMLVISTPIAHANRAVMNPMHPIDMQFPEEEPPSVNLKAELRMPHTTSSEVMELLAEDETRSQGNSSSKNPGPLPPEAARMDCSKITMQIFQVLLQNPDTVEPEDYSCGLLNLISHFEKSNGRIRALEASLHTATTTIKTLEGSLQTEMSKTQFLMKELNETVHKETERAIKAENVIARRVLSEKSRVDGIQKNLTDILGSSLEQLKEFEVILRQIEHSTSSQPMIAEKEAASTPYNPAMALLPQSSVSEEDIKKIEGKLTSLQQFIQDLSSRISHMEDGSGEHMNKGIAQIFKTYASLANEIEKETERATGEEGNLKNMITNEIAALGKQIQSLQDRITDEKNRVQVIENRRTADLFEEINRAKSEETRLGQKLKDEMSKAAAAFKRLEQHVDTQMNSTKNCEEDLRTFAINATRRVTEAEEKLTEQISLERTRALSAENILKMHVDTEMQRAMGAEKDLRALHAEERDRTRAAEHELKVAIDVETYRAKGVEFSISGQITAEMERAKQEEYLLHEHINANMTRLLTDIIKEFTRAQNAEMELSDKIIQETSRATGAEQSLLENINAELSRATNKEQELFYLIKTQENSTKVVDQCRNLIESEISRARNAETNLESQIHGEVSRAKGSEEKLQNMMANEISSWKSFELNLTLTSNEVIRHSKELELEVRKTVMAEVARAVDAENGLKQQIFSESERARGAEMMLSMGQAGNYSEISNRMQEMIREVEKDSLRLEDISLQISRNLTGDILTLAELFDDKLDDLERSENIRLKKIEDDMKKCCSGSSWRWRSPKGKAASGSAAGTVINKIMQVFGAINEEDQDRTSAPSTHSKKSASKASRPKGDISKGRSMDDNHAYSVDENDEDVNALTTAEVSVINRNGSTVEVPKKGFLDRATNETVVYINSEKVIENDGVVQELPEKVKVPRKISLRSGRRANAASNMASTSGNRDSLVSVQSVNSKVTSTFG